MDGAAYLYRGKENGINPWRHTLPRLPRWSPLRPYLYHHERTSRPRRPSSEYVLRAVRDDVHDHDGPMGFNSRGVVMLLPPHHLKGLKHVSDRDNAAAALSEPKIFME